MNGVINVLKPPGMTSHDVVSYVRRELGRVKVGHTGTLDPGAAGVLLLCTGRATKIARFLQASYKVYRAELVFGLKTTTGDAYGEPVLASDDYLISRESLEKALSAFTGRIKQVPPMTSAIKVGGQKLYALARRGRTVDRPERMVEISSIRILDDAPEHWDPENPRVLLEIACSSGTYIRTLCEDLGEYLGCPSHMGFLLRTRVGRFDVSDSSTLEEIRELAENHSVESVLISMDEALDEMPVIRLDSPKQARLAVNGNPVICDETFPAVEYVRIHGPDDRLLVIGRTERRGGKDLLKPVVVIAGPESFGY